MKRKLLILLILLVALTITLTTRSVCAFGFCTDCGQQCRNESFHHFNQCRENGGSVAFCDEQQESYNANCQSVFCSGCPFLPL